MDNKEKANVDERAGLPSEPKPTSEKIEHDAAQASAELSDEALESVAGGFSEPIHSFEMNKHLSRT